MEKGLAAIQQVEMLKGFEEYTKPLTPDEKRVAGYVSDVLNKYATRDEPLRAHAIIMHTLQLHGHNVAGQARLRKIINQIVMHGLIPNICTSSKGYWVETDLERLKQHSNALKDRAKSILARAEIVDTYIAVGKLTGQHKMFNQK